MEQRNAIAAVAIPLGIVLIAWNTVKLAWEAIPADNPELDREVASLLANVPKNQGYAVGVRKGTGVVSATSGKSLETRSENLPKVEPKRQEQARPEPIPETYEWIQGKFAETKKLPTSPEPPNPEPGMVWHTDAGNFSYRDTGVWLLIWGPTWYKSDPNETRAANYYEAFMGCKKGAYLPPGTHGNQSDVIGCK